MPFKWKTLRGQPGWTGLS